MAKLTRTSARYAVNPSTVDLYNMVDVPSTTIDTDDEMPAESSITDLLLSATKKVAPRSDEVSKVVEAEIIELNAMLAGIESLVRLKKVLQMRLKVLAQLKTRLNKTGTVLEEKGVYAMPPMDASTLETINAFTDSKEDNLFEYRLQDFNS